MSFLDLTETKENSFDCLPAGAYILLVKDAVVKTTRDGNGEYISLSLEVRGGGNDGRVVFENYNIKNANAKAVEIGFIKLKQLMKASGKTDFQIHSVSELCGLKFVAEVAIKSDSYGEKNYIKKYLSEEEGKSKVSSELMSEKPPVNPYDGLGEELPF